MDTGATKFPSTYSAEKNILDNVQLGATYAFTKMTQ